MGGMTAVQVRNELNSTESSVEGLTGQSTKPWFRPPFGAYSEVSQQAAWEAGWTTVIWTGSAEDWREGVDEDKMCRNLRRWSAPGAILYTHANRTDLPPAVDRYLGEMQDQGYTFVPLSVLMTDDPEVWLKPIK